MRILYVLDEFSERTAGTEGQFLELIAGMRARNAQVCVAVLRGGSKLEQTLADVPFLALGLTSLRSLSALRALRKLTGWARAQRSQLAHLYFNDTSIACPIPLRLAGLPVVVSRRDLGIWYTSANLRLLRVNRWAISAVVANADAVKKQVIAQEHYPERKVITIYNAWRDRAACSDPASLKGELGIPASAKVLLSLGNLRPLKRVDDSIRVLALVRAARDDVWLCIVGADRVGSSGSERSRLQALAVELGVANYVVFAGSREDPWPLVQACDIGLFCSESEGLSNALIEYCAAGKPVVCSAAGGNAEVVVDGMSGFIFPTGDVRTAAERVERLLRDAVLAAEMGGCGRRRVIECFSVEHMIDRHMVLYRGLIAHTRFPVALRSNA